MKKTKKTFSTKYLGIQIVKNIVIICQSNYLLYACSNCSENITK